MLNAKKIVGLLCALGLVGCGAPEFEQAPAEGFKGAVEVGQKEQEALNSTDVAEGRPASRNAAGGLVYVVRASDNRIYTSEQNGLLGGWTGWRAVGTATFPNNPVLARNANGTLLIFAVNSAGAVLVSQQVTSLGAWGAWTSLGGTVAGRVGVARNGDGRLQLFARSTTGTVVTLAQTAANGAWGAWTSLGGSGVASDPAAVRNGNGRLQVFVRNTTNALLTLQQLAVNGAWPTTWTSLGSPYYGNPSVSLDSAGRIAVFARGANNALFYTQQSAAGATTWTAWFSLGGSLVGDPSVHRYNTTNLLSVVVRSAANGMEAIDQLSATTWSAWGNLGVDGAVAGSPTFFTNEGALPALFFRDTTGNIVYNEAYTDGFSTYWTGYYYIGNPLSTLP